MKAQISRVPFLALALLLALIPARVRRTTAMPAPAGRGAQASGESPAAASYFPGSVVEAALNKGQPLVPGPEGGRNYAVLALRRDHPGETEIHTVDTDIFYVLGGTATVVIGGKAVDPKATAPNEMRAPRIDGGSPRRLGKGDVLVIAPGVPHWFKAVEPPFLYLVVKVRK